MSITESMEEKKRRVRRSFSDQFKAEVIDLCLWGTKTIAEVARDLDLTESAVRHWVTQAESENALREPKFPFSRYFLVLQPDGTLRGLMPTSA
jgi:transposase